MAGNTRFWVDYELSAETRRQAAELAEKISIEQTVEMPLETVPASASGSMPELLGITQTSEYRWKARISYPISVVDGDPIQLLNVLYGNVSLLPDIKCVDVSDEAFTSTASGPAFGLEGIRDKTGGQTRPVSCTALKPVGLDASELAKRCYQFARGGIDMIKDDHGLTDQATAPFKTRVTACVRAVRKGEQHSGKRTLYLPNITTAGGQVAERFQLAVELGADGVLICPQLTGLGVMHSLAAQKTIPIMAHPAFSGPYVMNSLSGFSMKLFYGKIWRAFGADAVIYPNAGGRFTFSRQSCVHLHRTLREPFCDFKSAFPTPAGGISLESVPQWIDTYGNNTLFLIGSSLYKQSEGIEQATLTFQNMLKNYE